MRGGILAALMALIAAEAGAQSLRYEPGEDPHFNWASYQDFARHRLDGQKLSLSGVWLGPDKDMFESVIAYFEAATGADVRYEGSSNFEQKILIEAEAGTPPDIAIFPQPGLAADFARRGWLRPLAPGVEDWVRQNYYSGDTWAGYGRYVGPDGRAHFYGFPFKAEIKSLVWYIPENFVDAGYEVPRTLEQLRDLTVRIAADGETPWCIGVGSGGATGWPATDWVEDMMLRMGPVSDYDDWALNRLRFDDPKVVAAIEAFGWFALNGDYVAGGGPVVAATDFRDAPAGLFTAPPGCWLHRQASFVTAYFPDASRGVADFFYLPTRAADTEGQPVLGAGTMVAKLTDNPAADVFISFLQTPIAHEIWMAQTGFTTPLRTVNPEVYGDDISRKLGEVLRDATVFRFDASDLMPGAIGAGAFWTGMIDYLSGKPAPVVARDIQRVWDGLGR